MIPWQIIYANPSTLLPAELRQKTSINLFKRALRDKLPNAQIHLSHFNP